MSEKQEDPFTVIVEPCEDGGYFAICPEFPGCQVRGKTYEQTLEKMRSAIDSLIEDYKEDGEEYLGLK